MNEGIPKTESKKVKTDHVPERSLEISGEMIEKVLMSPEFIKTLQKTISMVMKHHREIGFSIIKEKKTNLFHYSKPLGGITENVTMIDVGITEIGDKLKRKKLEHEDWFIFGTFHFHGYEYKVKEKKVIIPSGSDMDNLFSNRQIYNFPSIQMIAGLLSEKDIEVLIYQESGNAYNMLKKSFVQEELNDVLQELFESNATQDEVIQELQKFGFKAGMVIFENGQLTKESIKFVRSLGVNPKVGL